MRIYRFWSKIEGIIDVDGKTQRTICHGGSNESIEAAIASAQNRLERIQRHVHGEPLPSGDYEVEIREEITHLIDTRNIVTRNRYGAEVLNSTSLMFMDIDQPRLRLWEWLFPPRSTNDKQKRIVSMVKGLSMCPEYRGLIFRVYMTHSGVRVLVTGKEFDPKDTTTHKMMSRFHGDPLYIALCHRQGCFRARLTPKPFRMKQSGFRVHFPRETQEEETAQQEWVTSYNSRRQAYATCHFLTALGGDSTNALIQYHDQTTGAFSSLPLA